jgi:hypothetical protein
MSTTPAQPPHPKSIKESVPEADPLAGTTMKPSILNDDDLGFAKVKGTRSSATVLRALRRP